MLTRVTFLHVADLHLDSPFLGLKYLPPKMVERIQESTFTSFKNIINIAIEQKVDFIIVAGDLFDSEQRSLKAQLRFRDEMVRLHKVGIQAFITHGNHDHLNGGWISLDWPSNVHFFGESVEMKQYRRENQGLVHLYGFSYKDRSVTENMTPYYKKISGSKFHIGILHGSIFGNEEHSTYAPFTVHELLEKEFDYWALGHIHKRQVLSEQPPIIYPGNIQGRHRKEIGRKGCYFVELSELGTTYSFMETGEVIWNNIVVSIDSITSFDELVHACIALLEDHRSKKGTLFHLQLIGSGELSSSLQDETVIKELIDILHTPEEDRDDFVWISSVENKTVLPTNREQLIKEMNFLGDLLQIIESYDQVDQTIAPLYRHRNVRKHLTVLTKEERQSLIADAEAFLLQELLNTK
ncbi:exonuclease SbcCD subunit D [Bacillus salitolerans]|uniref:Exonuclease SbcCD subunit D n=1 Tax=Bacillus salitolerans TaxID=1437434 RepID=A0ABW4LXF3_9BACI